MYSISDYRDCQSHGPVIAERVWTAWWQDSGLQVGDVAEHLKDMTNPIRCPPVSLPMTATTMSAPPSSSIAIWKSGRNICPGSQPFGWRKIAGAQAWHGRSCRRRHKGPPNSVTRPAISAASAIWKLITPVAAGPFWNVVSANTI